MNSRHRRFLIVLQEWLQRKKKKQREIDAAVRQKIEEEKSTFITERRSR